MNTRRPYKTIGFSALELVTAIAVFTLILFFAWPHFQQRRLALLAEDLVQAAEANDRDAIMKALNRGAPPDAWSGASPHYCLRCKAIIDSDLEMLRYFLDLDSWESPETVAHHHRMLLEAIQNENIEALEELLAAGALASQVTRRDPDFAASVFLNVAIERENTEIVRTLLEFGLPPNGTYHRGDTPLHQAARLGNIALIEILLAYGADTTAKDDRYMLPKDVANYECRTEIQQMLALPGR